MASRVRPQTPVDSPAAWRPPDIWRYLNEPTQGTPRTSIWRLLNGSAQNNVVQHRKARPMAKRFGRPSLHYRYEHYDPR
jgi:hypothetical protein